MKLDEFITTSLVSIQKGIIQANIESGKEFFKLKPGGETIDFDVALSVQSESGNGGGVSVGISSIGINANLGSKNLSESVSRLKFSVKVLSIIG